MSQPEGTEGTAEALSRLLAESYALYLKTHNYHWNVTGPMFQSLHLLFETQYTELATAVDEIAERIRSLGHRAPGSFREFAELASVPDAEGTPSAEDMVRDLAAGNGTVAAAASAVFEVASAAGDEATAGLAIDRVGIHEKAAWMLRSHLE